MKKIIYSAAITLLTVYGCSGNKSTKIDPNALKPSVITATTANDTDDPAIWVSKTDASKSLIIGTDKASNGGLYLFDLQGKIIKTTPLKRPNNVDIAYDFTLNGKKIDIAVATERETNKIRVFSMPDLTPIDNEGIDVFSDSEERAPMGIALYKRSTDGQIFAIVGRKSGPKDGYLYQYMLKDNGKGQVIGELIRKFGAYSGKKEIEAIAVDNELGTVYYSDEGFGVHKYAADPNATNQNEMAVFAKEGFTSDHEGISIYKTTDTTGYILVSNQQDNSFMVYPREGANGNPNDYPLLAKIPVSTMESDGSDVTQLPLNSNFPKGMFVAMSNGRVFHYYDWRLMQEIIDQNPKK